ncbi:MAG: DNA translocase FtsK 4TM domain-containing protein [Bacteroidales bacterium]
MAKKNKKKKKTPFYKDGRFRLSIGLFLIGFGFFLTLAFISFLFTWKTDQSFEWSRVISEPGVSVENWSGKTGARFANSCINHWFGLASFILPLLIIVTGIRLLGIRFLPLRRTIRISLIGMIILSVLLGYIGGERITYLGSGLGGGHGYYVSRYLVSLLGMTGTGLLLFIAIASFMIFSFPGAYEKLLFIINPSRVKDSTFHEIDQDLETAGYKEDITREIEDDKVGLVFEHDPTESLKKSKRNDKTQPEFETEQQIEEEEIELIKEEKTEDIPDEDDENESLKEYDPTADLPGYQLPSPQLLDEHKSENSEVSDEELIRNKDKIVETLGNYNIKIDKIKATIGPTVTLYEIVPAAGIRISKIKNLEDDIALSLAALGIRIIAPIPGKGTIGIEVPNQHPEIVSMRSIITSKKFQESKFDLPIGLGKTISNETYVVDLTKMPHLLVAGATGQGKSVGLNAILTSLLYKKHPSQLKFVLVDPKKVELTPYSKIEKHFLAKLPDADEAIVTNTQKVIHTLNSLTIEMDERYNLLKAAHVRNLKEYNSKFVARRLNPEKGHRFMPYIVVVIDEFADMIMTAGREIEGPIARLAQLARAVGIHLIIATQRPTTNIITGVIKANFPARIAFRVTSMIDSRTILDTPGANQLIGRGDMLITTGGDITRIQCAFLDTPETEKITDFIGAQKGYISALYLPEVQDENDQETGEVDLRKRDDLFEEAARLIVLHQQGSTSLIQRKFSIGYNRAGRIIDQLEAAGIVGPFEGSKARQVLIQDEYSLEQILNEINNLM